jgi:hypothetical protein
VKNFLLASVHILDFAQLCIVPGCGETMSLTENMLRVELKGLLGTRFNTQGVPLAEITFEGSFDVIMQEHGTERTADEALVTGDAFFHIQADDTVLFMDRVGGTVFTTFRDTALSAYNGHPDYRMGIENHHSDPAFFGIVDSFATHAAGQFTDLAPGTPFRYDRQMHEKPP